MEEDTRVRPRLMTTAGWLATAALLLPGTPAWAQDLMPEADRDVDEPVRLTDEPPPMPPLSEDDPNPIDAPGATISVEPRRPGEPVGDPATDGPSAAGLQAQEIEESGQDEGEPAERLMPERDQIPPRTVQNTLGGGRPAEEQYFARALAGLPVLTVRGEEVGEVADLVVDTVDGEIDTLVISAGGFLGMGDELYGVPWDAVTFDKQEEVLTVDRTMAEIEVAPRFEPEVEGSR